MRNYKCTNGRLAWTSNGVNGSCKYFFHECSGAKGYVNVGTSRSRTKTVSCGTYCNCPRMLGPAQLRGYVGGWNRAWQDTFEVSSTTNNRVTVTRTDANAGWGANIRLRCCRGGTGTGTGAPRPCTYGGRRYNNGQHRAGGNCSAGYTGNRWYLCVNGRWNRSSATAQFCARGCAYGGRTYARNAKRTQLDRVYTCGAGGRWAQVRNGSCMLGSRRYTNGAKTTQGGVQYVCNNSFWQRSNTHLIAAGSCTGPRDSFGGLTPNAPWRTACFHACVTYRTRKWCLAKPARTGAQPKWGWCYPCNAVPRDCRYADKGLVTANWQNRGRYYGGVVTGAPVIRGTGRAAACSYTIVYSDGDRETNVLESRLRPVTCLGFGQCDRVQVNYRGRGRWYAARISSHRVRGSGCTQRYGVKYDDGDTETNVLPTNVRRMTASRSGTFRANQAIEANYRGRGRWYAGRIAQVVSPCCYNVRYGDGDTEACVDPLKLRTVAVRTCTDSGRRPCRAGFRMQGNWRGYGRYYPGTVTACTNGAFSLTYDDGSRETGVLGTRIRNCAAATCNRATLTLRVNQGVTANFQGRGRFYQGVVSAISTATCTYTITFCDGDREVSVPVARVRASSTRCSCTRGQFTIGRSVTVNWSNRGRFFPAKLCGCSSATTYKVCYNDGDKEARVPTSRIRIA